MSSVSPSVRSSALSDLSRVAARVAEFKDRPLVVKFGGSVQDDPAQTRAIIDDIAALAQLGLNPIVVHGGGKAISAAMTAAGLTSRFIAGQRYTDAPALAIAERVLAGQINAEIVRLLTERGVRAVSLTTLGCCVLRAARSGASDEHGHPIDLGLVGQVEHVQADVLHALCNDGIVPVIAPVAQDVDEANTTGKLNVNADLAAGMVAQAIRPRAFILVSDTPGIRTDAADPASCAARLSVADIARLKQSKVVDGGMLPKVQACLMALDAGVGHVAITDGRQVNGLLSSVLSETFPGTLLTA